MARIKFEGVGKRYPNGFVALENLDLDIRDREFLVLLGPSGCGKSTTLNMIAGLEDVSQGNLYFDDALMNAVPPHRRDVAMVFQSYALYPHKSVYDNIAFGLAMRKHPRSEIDARVRDAARRLEIEALLERRPNQLSGGQRQRVALGRAMVRRPAAFLMDEPLSNLDAKLRVHMRTELADLHARLGATFIYVTHDQVEAMTMSNRVAMMDGGRVLQLGRPAELYARPASVKVAQFIGTPTINLLPARVGSDRNVELFGLPLPIRVRQPAGAALTLGIRPESITPAPLGARHAGHAVLAGRLHRSENLGAEHILHVDLVEPASGVVTCKVASDPESLIDETRSLALLFPPAACHVFDAEGQRIGDLEVASVASATGAAPKSAVYP